MPVSGAGAGRGGPPRRVVFRWDLDKTYLKSEFDSFRDLVRISLERGEDKVSAPGVAPLIRALRGYGESRGREVGIYFLSASPPQIAKAIRDKLALDGIVYDGIVFKDQLQRIVRGKFRHLREQVGYKLTELLRMRQAEPQGAVEYLFGDDWESDPLIYSLYADVAAGRIDSDRLRRILQRIGVDPPLIRQSVKRTKQLEPTDAVRRIFIHLERGTPPAQFTPYGRRLVPTRNYFQTAACLFEEDMLDLESVAAVARSIALFPDGLLRLQSALQDMVERGDLSQPAAILVRRKLEDDGILPRRPRGRLEGLMARRRLREVRRRRSRAGVESSLAYLEALEGDASTTESRDVETAD